MKPKVYLAPELYFYSKNDIVIFLAGSIEQGKAENWQDKVMASLKKFSSLVSSNAKLVILNPRRKDWDSSWEQSIDNKQFREQVEWELTGQENSTIIAMYFDPKTKSPITLLELGLFKDSNLIVCCPDGYWRKGNVDIVCHNFNIKQIETFEEFVQKLKLEIFNLIDKEV
jgi:hypothetical protein